MYGLENKKDRDAPLVSVPLEYLSGKGMQHPTLTVSTLIDISSSWYQQHRGGRIKLSFSVGIVPTQSASFQRTCPPRDLHCFSKYRKIKSDRMQSD